MSRAWLADSVRMRSRRAPGEARFSFFTQQPSGAARAVYTNPTGLPRSSGSGPATPVADTARSTPSALRAPWAISSATSAHTAPLSSSRAWDTPSTPAFTSQW